MPTPPPDNGPPSAPSEERRPAGNDGLEPGLFIEALEKPRHDPYAALRSPNYRAFASGYIFSTTGLAMLSTGLGLEIWQRTHNPMALGLMGLARAIPVILLALPAGHIVDLYSRKLLLVGSQLSFAILTAALAWLSYAHAPVWAFFIILALSGCARVVNGPTRQSLLPLIVPRGAFSSAVTWNSGVNQFSAVVGPIAAGALIAGTGAFWPVYLCTALGTLVMSLSSTRIRLIHTPPAQSRFSIPSMFAGLSHLWHEKTILATIALDLFAVLFGGAMGLLPIFAEQILAPGTTFLGLHHASVRLGLLRAAPYIGALVMALVLAHRPPIRRNGPALLFSVAAFGLAWVVFGLSRNFWLSIAVLALAGALDNISVVIRHVLVQMRTPDHLRGRVSAVNSVFIESSNELGAFESGAVARLAATWLGTAGGAVVSVVTGGIGTVLVVLAVAAKWPQVRRLGRLEEP